ncbi:RNA 2',3'-cyclic phosphodiesterase [Streptomyces longispororuber]|uniref:RNA 2',3'-cyclic phosphodiesterase n=1 Tax=Streptomyces longispororuber TaxID=68230 RepID=A0A919DV14_9ACTN|nr:RNA 2',3'-cyclic phosphodiesterase [Streptomyces longispororuber]GHE80960.1 RNA 2',3'-cyclic phosphodiesterase [Streptomyces longispororuber]
MRLFAAVLPPEAVVAELGGWVAGVRRLPGAEALRWTERAGWHLTLAFLGEVDDGLVPDLEARYARAARRTEPFPLALSGGGHFGGRALWAGLTGDVAALRLLAARAEAGARRARVAMDARRGFHPHLTVARSRGEADLRPYVEALAPFEGAAWQADELSLVRSHLPVGGSPGARPRYERLAGWPLGRG